MRKSIFPLKQRLAQCRDILLLATHPNRKLHEAKKELLWYRGKDNYKQVFSSIFSKFNRQDPVLADDNGQFATWINLSDDAKAICIYLGFHSASTNNNSFIASLVQEYRDELNTLFDFSYDAFKITGEGGRLLRDLYNTNRSPNVVSMTSTLMQVRGVDNRTQKRVMVEAKNVVFSGDTGSGSHAVSLFQCMQNKSPYQAMFVIQKLYLSEAAISINQHAYNHQKQFDFYMDEPSTIRHDYQSTAAQICKYGGYYYGSAQKNLNRMANNSGEQYLVDILTKTADVVCALDHEEPPIIFIDIGNINKALTLGALCKQIERLCNSTARVCIVESEVLDPSNYYNAIKENFGALHFVGSHHKSTLSADVSSIKIIKGRRELLEGEYNVSNKNGTICGGGVIKLDCEFLAYQVKGRFIRYF